MQIRRKNN